MPLGTEEIRSQAAEFTKKILAAGIGAAFMTEESLRALVKEFRLPKEIIAGILESANRTKSEFFSKLSEDVIQNISKMRDKIDPAEVLQEVIRKNDIQFDVKVRITPRDKDSSK